MRTRVTFYSSVSWLRVDLTWRTLVKWKLEFNLWSSWRSVSWRLSWLDFGETLPLPNFGWLRLKTCIKQIFYVMLQNCVTIIITVNIIVFVCNCVTFHIFSFGYCFCFIRQRNTLPVWDERWLADGSKMSNGFPTLLLIEYFSIQSNVGGRPNPTFWE